MCCPTTREDFPAAEIHSIARYLFAESAGNLEGKDTYRVQLQQQLHYLQDKLSKEALDERDRKELFDVTHRLSDLALLSIPGHSGEINSVTSRLRQAQDAMLEQYEKIRLTEERIKEGEKHPDDKKAKADAEQATQDRDAAQAELEKVKKELEPLALELEKIGLVIPIEKQIVDAQGEIVATALPEAEKNDQAKHLTEGRRLFSERGCLACHVHDGVRQKAADGLPAVSEEAASFAPDLSRIAAKIYPPEGRRQARRRWVVQWVLNPNIYHPRTRMPITHLNVQQACDVADWLLSQEVDPEDDPRLAGRSAGAEAGNTGGAGPPLSAQGARHDRRQGERSAAGRCGRTRQDSRVRSGRFEVRDLRRRRAHACKGRSRATSWNGISAARASAAWAVTVATTCRASRRPSRSAPPSTIGARKTPNGWRSRTPTFTFAQHHNIVDARDSASNPHQPAAGWQTQGRQAAL